MKVSMLLPKGPGKKGRKKADAKPPNNVAAPEPRGPCCPFCKSEVEEDLLRLGGHCPNCLIEIPGEEAATDPGAEAQEAEAAARAARDRSRTLLHVGLVAVMLVGLCVGGYLLTAGEEPVISFAKGYPVIGLGAHKNLRLETEEDIVEKPRSTSRGRGSSSQHVATAPEQTAPAGDAVADGEPAKDEKPDYGINSVFGSHGPRRRTPKAIEACGEAIAPMVQAVMLRGKKELRACAQGAGVATGDWTVALEVQKDGSAQGVDVVDNLGGNDAATSCMLGKARQWHFGAVCTPTPATDRYKWPE